MADRPQDDLDTRLDELEETLDALREELRPRRGPLGMPRPPSPREVLRFADEYAIPAGIAVLEAQIRTLELLRGAIRAAERDDGDATARDRTVAASRGTLDRLDDALSDLASAFEDSDLPRSADARRLLSEARDLNAEIEGRIAAIERETGSGVDEGEAIEIDVEAELDQIRDEIEDEGDGDGGNAGGDEAADRDETEGNGAG